MGKTNYLESWGLKVVYGVRCLFNKKAIKKNDKPELTSR